MPTFSPTFFSSVFFDTGGGSASPQVIYRDHQWSVGTNFTTCTWAAMAVGPAASDRWVIAALNINHNTSRAISTVSIGGVAATKLYAAPSPRSDDGVSFEFWAANVPTGTTADVVATAASGQFWDGAAWTYTCAGQPIFHDGEVDQSLTSNTFSVAIDVAEGGAVIALANGDEPASLSAWAGVTSDFTDEGRELYAASADQLTAETGRTVSWTGTAAPSPNTTFYGIGVVSVRFAGGGGTYLDSPGVSIGGGVAQAAPAAIRGSDGRSVGGASATAPAAAIRGSAGSAVGAGVASALGGLLLSSSGVAIAAGLAAAPPALIRPSEGTSQAGAQAASPAAAIRVSAGTSIGASLATAMAALIRSSVGVSVGGSAAEAQLSALSYLISVAVAVGGSFAVAPPAAIVSAPATAVGSAASSAPPAMIRSAPGSVVAYAVARATAAVILGSQGVSIGCSAVAAAAALIRSAPAVALSLSQSAAPPAMIRSGTGSASGLAIAAGLGILVPAVDYSSWRLAFATEKPRTGTILNKATRKGEILNATRRGRLQELKE